MHFIPNVIGSHYRVYSEDIEFDLYFKRSHFSIIVRQKWSPHFGKKTTYESGWAMMVHGTRIVPKQPEGSDTLRIYFRGRVDRVVDWMWGMRERQVPRRTSQLLGMMSFFEIEKLDDTMCSCPSAWGS